MIKLAKVAKMNPNSKDATYSARYWH